MASAGDYFAAGGGGARRAAHEAAAPKFPIESLVEKPATAWPDGEQGADDIITDEERLVALLNQFAARLDKGKHQLNVGEATPSFAVQEVVAHKGPLTVPDDQYWLPNEDPVFTSQLGKPQPSGEHADQGSTSSSSGATNPECKMQACLPMVPGCSLRHIHCASRQGDTVEEVWGSEQDTEEGDPQHGVAPLLDEDEQGALQQQQQQEQEQEQRQQLAQAALAVSPSNAGDSVDPASFSELSQEVTALYTESEGMGDVQEHPVKKPVKPILVSGGSRSPKGRRVSFDSTLQEIDIAPRTNHMQMPAASIDSIVEEAYHSAPASGHWLDLIFGFGCGPAPCCPNKASEETFVGINWQLLPPAPDRVSRKHAASPRAEF